MAIVVEHEGIKSSKAETFYSCVNLRIMTDKEKNTIFEQLLFALHQCSALKALKLSPNKSDVARVGIVAWYYGIYAAASAMVTAKDGSFQDTHTSTAQTWDHQIAKANLVCPPFHARISSLDKQTSKRELDELSTKKQINLATDTPSSIEDAEAACKAYLSGSVNWWRKRTEEDIKQSKEFRCLGVSDFKKNKARDLRDERLKKRSVGFLHQAFRYRGKANYRDAIFLGYGTSVDTMLSGYIDDLSKVLEALVTLSGVYCSKRLETKAWNDFIDDLEKKRAFSLPPNALWK